MNKQNYQLREMVLEMRSEGKNDKEIANELLVHFNPTNLLIERLLGIINHLDEELTSAYEEVAGESL